MNLSFILKTYLREVKPSISWIVFSEAPAFSALITEDGTGVQSVPTALQAHHFYDLMGRPVSHKQQGHVYVQQGSKVMIK